MHWQSELGNDDNVRELDKKRGVSLVRLLATSEEFAAVRSAQCFCAISHFNVCVQISCRFYTRDTKDYHIEAIHRVHNQQLRDKFEKKSSAIPSARLAFSSCLSDVVL